MNDAELFVERSLELSTGTVSYIEAGTGTSVVCLHHSWGSIGAIEFHERLAKSFHVIVPDMPGWGASTRPLWARDVRDIAILCAQFIHHLQLDQVHLIGLGFGGYVAAEMSSMNASGYASMTLVGAPGLFPEEGEIRDQMMFSHRQYIRDSFSDEATYTAQFGDEPSQEIRDVWEHSREMTARVAWKPYFFNRRLEPLLGNVATPTLLLWGAEDQIVPISVAHQMGRQLKDSKLEILQRSGHLVEFEQPDAAVQCISKHITQHA